MSDTPSGDRPDRMEERLRGALHARAERVEPAPGGWAAVAARVAAARRRRRRLVMIALPAMAVAAVFVVVGVVVLTDDPGPGPRLRTNPALPGHGPPRPTTTEAPSAGPVAVTSGPGWHLLVGPRDDVGWCAQVRPRSEDDLDPTFCGASQREFDDRGISLAFIDRPPSGGAPTTLPPATVAYGFVPVESADVVLALDSGASITIPALPFDDALDAFAGELPAGAAVIKVTVWDGDGRVLYEEDLRAAD